MASTTAPTPIRPPAAEVFTDRFPADRRDHDAPHRRMLAPLADLLAVATEAAQAHRDPTTAARLDQAWLLVSAALLDTQSDPPDGTGGGMTGAAPAAAPRRTRRPPPSKGRSPAALRHALITATPIWEIATILCCVHFVLLLA